MEEIFKTIKEYPDYEVSNLGRIKTKRRAIRYTHPVTKEEHFRYTEERFLKVYQNVSGYKFVQLYKDKKSKNKTIHRLVATEFIDNEENLKVVNHKDGNKHNNTFFNLEWCTNEYNHQHAVATGLKASGSRIGNSVLNEKCAIAIKNLYRKGYTENFISEVFEASKSTIHYAINNWNKATPQAKHEKRRKHSIYNGIGISLLNSEGKNIKYWISAKKAGIELKLDPGRILDVARGKANNYKGYKFALTGEELDIKM